ncbi:hypothetical protein CHUAL_013914 [Chamberlinius hualienensis]
MDKVSGCNTLDGFNLKVRYLSENENGFSSRIRGCDPRAQTCRGKLQNKRSELNKEINKELMLRKGAEKLYRATNNKKLKETVSLELRFVNSKLQHLKQQLADLNSSVDIYQNDKNCYNSVPMIPLGLKETSEVDYLTESLQDMILQHYSEKTDKFDEPISELNKLRQAIRTPSRDHNGTALLFRYYHQLYFVERRFYSSERNLGLHFEWFDALTGVPTTQKTISFEKANVLFNIAAVYTQIGARQDRSSSAGIDSSVDSFLRAASMFNYIQSNFSNAPSIDLMPDTLEMLINLMLAQSRECLFEKLVNSNTEITSVEQCFEAGQEAAQVAEAYSRVHSCISVPPVKDYVPYSWILLILVKAEHFRALSHYFVSIGLLDFNDELSVELEDMLECIQISDANKTMLIDIKVPKNQNERILLGKSHLREALLHHEESLRVQRMSKQLHNIRSLKDKLIAAHNRALDKYDHIEEEDDFREVLDPPRIQASTKFQLSLSPPDFSLHREKDLFHDLGPLTIFNARNHWTVPRLINLKKGDDEPNFGFSIRGDSPVIVATVDPGSLAEAMGVKEGDFIVTVGEKDTKWMKHEQVLNLIKSSCDTLQMKLVTPTDRNYLRPLVDVAKLPSPCSIRMLKSDYMVSPTGSLSSTKSKDSQKKLTWNPFRRVASKEKQDTRSIFANVPSR